jgi:hypothetical protein
MRSETMSGGTQVDMDWAGTDAPGTPAASAPVTGAGGGTYVTDEEILGIDPPSPNGGFDGFRQAGTDGRASGKASTGSASEAGDGKDSLAEGQIERTQAEARATGTGMPSWMTALAADPRHGGEAQQLWREHQEFRAAFASPEEARAVKELLPGGVKDVLSLREATQSVERIDAALFSGDARAQSEVVAELARTNPAAFRSMFAEAARVLATMGTGGREAGNLDGANAGGLNAGPALRKDGEGRGTQGAEVGGSRSGVGNLQSAATQNASVARGASANPSVTDHGARGTGHEFDPAAYAAFERATNETVARDVRGSIGETLARVMPEGVAEGAARRMGEDIFNEVHRALAADRALSEQVASVLRDRRFGGAEQQRVAAILAGRAKQLVPSVARRVIGEWTSSVLQTSRTKAARQAAAASRVDIAAPGGSLDSAPLRARGSGSAREVNYAAMSDEEILGM